MQRPPARGDRTRFMSSSTPPAAACTLGLARGFQLLDARNWAIRSRQASRMSPMARRPTAPPKAGRPNRAPIDVMNSATTKTTPTESTGTQAQVVTDLKRQRNRAASNAPGTTSTINVPNSASTDSMSPSPTQIQYQILRGIEAVLTCKRTETRPRERMMPRR